MESMEADPATPAVETHEEKPLGKKRRRERRLALKKTQLCRHYDKPDGCPFPDCVYAHGPDELLDGGAITVTAQRKLIRDQGMKRQAEKFVHKDDATVVDYVARTGTMVDRYYTRLYAADIMDKPNEDQFVNMHSNRLCVIGIAPGHCIFTHSLTVTSITYESSVQDSKVTGKKKKGGVWLNPDTVVCRVTCSNDQTFSFRSCIRGALIEINDNLTANPTLLTEKPFTLGYLAIVRPKPVEIAEIQASLLHQDEYMEMRNLPRKRFC
ncbi:Mitochondrial inner membrane protease ATP23 [Aphanomyces cochlioides]|nr:Mitochondrial inner membrane protease ATP23 [Aphanomyces cochlioides]